MADEVATYIFVGLVIGVPIGIVLGYVLSQLVAPRSSTVVIERTDSGYVIHEHFHQPSGK